MTSPQFLELVVSLSVQVAAIVIVTHWLTRLVTSERMQCRLWTVCYTVLLSLLAVALLLPHVRLFHPWASADVQSTVMAASIQIQVGQSLFYIWLSGVIVSMLLFVFRAGQTSRFLKTCRPVEFGQVFDNKASGYPNGPTLMSGKRKVHFVTHGELTTPFCVQFHHPYIVLPEYLLGIDRDDLNFIIRHELEHLTSGHPLQLFLQRVTEVIFWFHPMVWWASHQSAVCREFACDEAAIGSPSDIGQYLRTLLLIVEYGKSQKLETRASLAFGRGKSIVAKRAQRLVMIARKNQSVRRFNITGSMASFCLVGTAILVTFIWLPVDVLASPRAKWSPWPTWSASVLHDFGISARDFEVFDRRSDLHEMLEDSPSEAVSNRSHNLNGR